MNYKQASKYSPLILFFIVFLGFLLRIFNITWDLGFHMHPDERMLLIVADRIHFFSQMDPQFFNYGSLPIYLLKGITSLYDALFSTQYATYDGMLIWGRTLSAIADSITILTVFAITRLLTRNVFAALTAAFVYAIAFFPIQNSHFFIVDPFLTLWISLLLYSMLRYIRTASFKWIILMSIWIAAAMATKVSAVLFLPAIALAVLWTAYIHTKKYSHMIIRILFHGGMLSVFSLFFHFLFMPYAYIQMAQFLTDTKEQLQMNSNPYVFPYTLQYVDTLPYLYYLKNIGLWGFGPFLSLLSLIGLGVAVVSLFKQNIPLSLPHLKKVFLKRSPFVVTIVCFTLFYLLYFIVIGKSSVKFMRYMLPLYPALAILAGYTFSRLSEKGRMVFGAIMIGACIWTLSFMNIYVKPFTRTEATNWINANIPSGATIAIEHWDDRLPITGSEKYQFETLELYNQPDDANKMLTIQAQLSRSDYIVIASNRLYIPIQKLKDCTTHIVCFPLSSQYYKDLFSGKLGFTKVAEFSTTPSIPFINTAINDQSADESFTVYDHPKVMIFKKTQ